MVPEEELPLPSGYFEKLQFASAVNDIGYLFRSEIVELAHDLLNHEYYDDLLLAIIDSDLTIWNNVYGHFEQFLNKHGIRSTDVQSAQLILLDHYLKVMKDMAHEPERYFFECYNLIGREEFYKICDELESLRELNAICHTPYQAESIEDKVHWGMIRERVTNVLEDPKYQGWIKEAFKRARVDPI